ncbi:thioesterase family protein [Streptomyces sp. NPDC003077]|uniref:acyl-CoA thioesterase n=1 Tax=Streptomyces sp. NPDC003077 TaxID=3154443 RepID=UPI0033A28AB4
MKTFMYGAAMRWADMNAYGIVGDAAMVSYVEDARAAFIRHIDEATKGREDREGPGPQLVHLTLRQRIDYLKPLRWQARPLTVSLSVLRIRLAALEMLATVGPVDRPFARARVLTVCWHNSRRRPHLITPFQRDSLMEYLAPEPP